MSLFRAALLKDITPYSKWVQNRYKPGDTSDVITKEARIAETLRFCSRHVRSLSSTLLMTGQEFIDSYSVHAGEGTLDVFLLRLDMDIGKFFGADCPLLSLQNIESSDSRVSAARRRGWKEKWIFIVKSIEPCFVVRVRSVNGKYVASITTGYVECFYDRAPSSVSGGMPFHHYATYSKDGSKITNTDWVPWDPSFSFFQIILVLPVDRRPAVFGKKINYKRELPLLAIPLALKEVTMSLELAFNKASNFFRRNDDILKMRQRPTDDQLADLQTECKIVEILVQEAEDLQKLYSMKLIPEYDGHLPYLDEISAIKLEVEKTIESTQGCDACFGIHPPSADVLTETKKRIAILARMNQPSFPDPGNQYNIVAFMNRFIHRELRDNETYRAQTVQAVPLLPLSSAPHMASSARSRVRVNWQSPIFSSSLRGVVPNPQAIFRPHLPQQGIRQVIPGQLVNPNEPQAEQHQPEGNPNHPQEHEDDLV